MDNTGNIGYTRHRKKTKTKQRIKNKINKYETRKTKIYKKQRKLKNMN